jgi:SRSO17 transposase
MTNAQLATCRKRLEHFLAELVAPLGRSERRRWADVYVRGLLLDGERKSIEPLAIRVPDGNVQALQQLVGLGAGLGAARAAHDRGTRA